MQSTRWRKRGTTVFADWPNAVLENFYECASNDAGNDQLWAYTDKLSYGVGDNLRLHVNTTAEHFDVSIYRDGHLAREVYKQSGIKGTFSPTPEDCSIRGCNWPVLLEIRIGKEWDSGGYIAYFQARGKASNQIYRHVFIVRPHAKRKDLLFIASTSTWLAYNDWGGSNHYEGIAGTDANQFAPIVSTQRPFSRGFAWLPVGAPRIPLRNPPEMGASPRYPHMEWAYASGYSKKYASAGWASYDRHFLRWAESAGYGVDVATQHDLHYGAVALEQYKCVVIVGHDEYWSWQMRDAIDAYVDAGGCVGRFAGNFHWQVRLNGDGTQQTCFKSRARTEDPVLGTPYQHLLTEHWESSLVRRPGTLTFGLNAAAGIYAGWGVCCPRGAGGFTVYRPEHWAFDKTDLYYGDVFGSESRIFGYEVDGLDYIIKGGLPFPTFSDGAHPSTEIIAMGLATLVEEDHGNPDSTFFIGLDDGRGIARTLLGSDDDASLDKVKRGSGMIVCFDRGKGTVFHAGTCEWVAGLIDRDPFVERITRNVLERFLARPQENPAQQS